MPTQRFRPVTRSDFDGLVCAVLLKELDLVDEIAFVHPKVVEEIVEQLNAASARAEAGFSGS